MHYTLSSALFDFIAMAFVLDFRFALTLELDPLLQLL